MMSNEERLNNVRRPEYNKAVLATLESIWNKHPDLRLVQLLQALKIIEEDNDGFYKENDVLFRQQTLVPMRETHILNYRVK